MNSIVFGLAVFTVSVSVLTFIGELFRMRQRRVNALPEVPQEEVVAVSEQEEFMTVSEHEALVQNGGCGCRNQECVGSQHLFVQRMMKGSQ